MEWVQSENMMKSGLQVVCMEAVGSSMKIDETWSAMVLKVEAFSEGVVAPFQW